MKLIAKNLRVVRENKTVLADCSATINSGSLTVIVGVNGAGKSTFLQTLAGQLPLESGSVIFGDRNLLDISAIERARRMAWLPHDQAYPFHVRVRNIVLLGRYPWHQGLPTNSDFAAVEDILEELELTHAAEAWVHTLSAGFRHRLALARAMVGRPEVLLLDEPTANLDPAQALGVMERLRAWANTGHAVVFSCHDLPLASQFADSILLLRDGKMMDSGLQRLSDLPLDTISTCLGIRVQWFHPPTGQPRLIYL